MTKAFEVRATSTLVEGWAEGRLPFEPRGPMLDYRSTLRNALRRLHPSRVLFSAYTSIDASPCDVENVLLYNVGLSAFSHLGATEVVAQRFFAPPPPNPGGETMAGHHHRYELIRRAAPAASATLASWPLTQADPPLTVERVWSALRREAAPRRSAGPTSARLSLEVVIEHPHLSTGPNVLAVMKTVVDGAMASLHAHDGSHLDDIAGRLGARLGRPALEVAAALMDPSSAVLGRRRLLWPYRHFVQWNPADDRLDFLRISSRPGETWRIGGHLQEMTTSGSGGT